MEITLNGSNFVIEKDMNILELLKLKDIKPERVVVEHNFNITDRQKWNTTIVKDKDNIEILKFVGGG